MKNLILMMALAISLAACSKDDDKKASSKGGITANPCGRDSVVSEAVVGTCKIRLITPKACEEIDLSSDDKVFEFQWTTDGTECPSNEEGRFDGFVGYIAGNPVTKNADDTLGNVNGFNLPNGGDVNQGGGIARLRARDLEGLTSTDGTYDWVIRSGLKAGPASLVFKIKRAQ